MASGSMQQIRRRLRSVQSTRQLTRAMELVASSKLLRAQEHAAAAHIYLEKMHELACRITAASGGISRFTVRGAQEKRVYVVLSGDRGLAGGYYANLFRMVDAAIEGKDARVIALGKKARAHYAQHAYLMQADDLPDISSPSWPYALAAHLLRLTEEGEAGEIWLCYTTFVSPLRQQPVSLRLIPALGQADKKDTQNPAYQMEYDSSPEAVLEAVMPAYLFGMLSAAAAQSHCAEQAARRMAMETASDNADDLIDRLHLSYNRVRQTAITQEIAEIVAGASSV
nr:ATP synthase F1 subunit gamma [uncultured Agathobaculum sp.]